MRKLESQVIREKKEKRSRMVVGVIIIGLLVLSSVGYALVFGGAVGGGTVTPGNTQEFEVNEDGAYFNGRYWVYTVGTQQYYFSYESEEVRTIPRDILTSLENYQGATVYVDSDSDISSSELALNLQNHVGILRPACYGSCEEDLPEKTCEEDIIIIRESENQRVYQEDKCIFIEGGLEATDAFLYALLRLS